jgi:DNA-binding GntR family transcriptional regulator
VIIQESLVDMATEEIRKLIVAGKFEPGERIYEPRLAEMLGISRPPLREALRILAAHHILEQTPRRGYHVVELTSRDVEEIYSLRRSLEDFGFEIAIPRLPNASLEHVEAAMTEMWSAARAGDEARVVLANRTFHEAAIDLADHRRLSQTYRSLMDQMQLCMSKNLRMEARVSGDLTEGCARHERLLTSFQSGDPEQIHAAIKSHGERLYLSEAMADTSL